MNTQFNQSKILLVNNDDKQNLQKRRKREKGEIKEEDILVQTLEQKCTRSMELLVKQRNEVNKVQKKCKRVKMCARILWEKSNFAYHIQQVYPF